MVSVSRRSDLSIKLFIIFLTHHAIIVSSMVSTPAMNKRSIFPDDEIQAIWTHHCTTTSRIGSHVKCSDKFNKIYLFDAEKKDYESARNYCRQQFQALPFAELVTIKNCEEYKVIKSMLMDIAAKMDSDGKMPMEIWTGGYEAPGEVGDSEANRRGWLTSEADVDYLNLDQACDDSPSRGEPSEAAKILTFKLHKSSNETENDYNLTEQFTPWDKKSETRFTLCEFKKPESQALPDTTPSEPGQDTTTEPAVTETSTVEVTTVTKLTSPPISPATKEEKITTVQTQPAPIITPAATTVAPTVPTTTARATTIGPASSTSTTGMDTVLVTDDYTPSYDYYDAFESEGHQPPTFRTTTTSTTTEATRTRRPPNDQHVPHRTARGRDCTKSKPAPRTCKPGTVGRYIVHCNRKSGNWRQINFCRKKLYKEAEDEIKAKKPAIGITNKLVDQIANKTSNFSAPSSGDVIAFVETSVKLKDLFHEQTYNASVEVRETKTKEFTKKLVEGFSTILDENHREAWDGLPVNNRTSVASNVISNVHETAFTLGCSSRDDEFAVNDENIDMETFVFEENKLDKDFFFPSWSQAMSKSSRVSFSSSLKLNRSEECDKYVVAGVIYKELSRHLTAGDPEHEDKLVNSNLVAFSLDNESRRTLPNKTMVRITLAHHWLSMFGDVPVCVFWDFEDGRWSRDGCWLVKDESFRNQTTCECNHLTNFAILMDIGNREDNSAGAKNVLTIVCCGLSAVVLSITILLILLVKSMRNRRSIITVNLSLCLLLANLLVIFGLDKTENTNVCRGLSGLLLVSLLAAFGWMLMEGYFLYQMVILVFQSVGYLNTFWLYFVGYAPALLVLAIFVTVAGPEGLYDSDFGYFCWISSRSHPYRIWAFSGPALIVVVLNIIVLVLSFREALGARRRKPNSTLSADTVESDRKNLAVITRWLKGWISLTILVGATWFTGILYIHESVSWFSYVFIVLNGLQGFFIFLFEVVFNSKARKALCKSFYGKIPLLATVSKTSSNLTIRTKSSSSLRTPSVPTPVSQMPSGLRKKRSNDVPMDPRPQPSAPQYDFSERM